MTRLGKILVFVNLVFSFVFVAWSVGLYTQRVPWQSYTTSDGEKVRGRIEILTEEIKDAVDARDKAEARYATANGDVLALEADIPRRRDFQKEQFKILMTGMDNAGKSVPTPARTPLVQNGLLALDRTKWAAFKIDDKDALSFAGYQLRLKQTADEMQDVINKTKARVNETTRITLEVSGTKPYEEAVTRVEKGLRGQLRDARAL